MNLDARDAAAYFDPTRLTLARQLQAITRTELARRAGLSAAAVSQFESGSNRPKPATLARLALALAVPVGFLASTGQPTLLPAVDDSFFRSLRRTTQRNRERAAAYAGLTAELVREIERWVELPPFRPMADLAVDGDDDLAIVEDAAQEVRRRWMVPAGPVDNLVELLERQGIVVVRLPLLTADVDAFSWTAGLRPIVVLGADKGVYERSRLDAAHEAAHVLLHAVDPEPASPRLEHQAQRFGSAFLAPAEELREEWRPGRIDWIALQRLRQRWGLSMGALLYRAKQLELISATAHTNAMKYMSKRGWRTREPGPRRPPEEPSLLASAVSLLADHGVSLDQLANDAHLIGGDDLRERLRLHVRRPLRLEL